MAALLGRYLAFTERRPLVSKIATAGAARVETCSLPQAGTLTTAGDLLAQLLSTNPIDFQRTARYSVILTSDLAADIERLAIWGFAWGGPTMHVWWRFLDRRCDAHSLRRL